MSEEKSKNFVLREKYPGRIPIIVERAKNCNPEIPELDKKKYLVPSDFTIGQFVYVLRKRIKLSAEKALFLTTRSGLLPPTASNLGLIDKGHMDKDGSLYLVYTGENTFG